MTISWFLWLLTWEDDRITLTFVSRSVPVSIVFFLTNQQREVKMKSMDVMVTSRCELEAKQS